jgi:hypothetical protein
MMVGPEAYDRYINKARRYAKIYGASPEQVEKVMSDPNRKQQKADAVAFKQRQHEEAVAGIEFQPWPKIHRLQREIVITEKIDGTNAAVGVDENGRVWAQSRNNLISPFKDNAGFAQWVAQHAGVLRDALGPGLHFGEWWGVGIQRGYGLSERRFSLFNSYKWGVEESGVLKLQLARSVGVAIDSVPILYRGPWDGDPYDYGEDNFVPLRVAERLKLFGSKAAPGFMFPEGIVVFHEHSGHMFKFTLDGDAIKGTGHGA